ncbi:hypothetical protein [Humisphaera borealis]|uniref:Uncharacterized protein n=1 Tax=Humisphaera borealis TaxID=2807512 RepID=A0A7M2WW40_9BACT|nr:hypothetical protein [Humisphaera borealis]QOV89623.1 hypothetical protein IPV69_26110 [Humisphaera borealis]
MTAILPSILFKQKRGLCPGCGAPLPLDGDVAQLACGFCGQKAVLERRLRKVEPEVADAPLRLYVDAESAEAQNLTRAAWVRSKQYREGIVGRASCPGCGDGLDYEDDATAIHCRTCGTNSRLERRLWSPPPDPETEVPRPRHPNDRRRATEGDHPDTEHLIYRILHETDADRRLAFARHFEQWTNINATSARLLPPLLESTKNAEPAYQRAVADLIGKLLCEGDPGLRNTAIRAAERFIFDVGCPRPIVFEVGLGDGVCLKPLLDAAEFACRRGEFEYACWCLHGVNLIFQRNYPQHPIMGQIILYRMLYLTGPVLAFAMLLAQRQFGIGFHYDAPTLLHFIDDAAVERPSLLPELDKSFYVGWPKDETEFRHRFDVYRSLKTDASRAAALRHYLRVPENATPAQWQRFFEFVLPIWDTEGPLKPAAEAALYAVVDGSYPTPDPVHELVKQRGRSLPVEVQRSYLGTNPKTPYLSYDGLPYWQSPKEPGLSPEMQKSLDEWKAGLHAAIDTDREARDAATERFRAVDPHSVELYDGKTDAPEPPPAPPTPEEVEATREAEQLHAESRKLMRDQMEQAIERMEAMREQVKTFSPESVKMIDEQIAQLRKQIGE